MKIVTAHQMRELDRRTIQEAGVPGTTLMERAGSGVVSAMEETFGALKGKTVTVFCGKGNNGGDGFVVARLLRQQRSVVQVCLLAQTRDLKGDAKLMYQRFIKSAGRSSVLSAPSADHMHQLVRHSHVLVDALLGTGTSSPITGLYHEAIHAMNASEAPTVAVDIPSGIDADTGATLGTAVQAHLTVTLGNPKLGLFLGAGIDHVGRLHCADIGIPAQFVEDLHLPIALLTPSTIRPWLPKRPASAHKGTFGHAGIIAGSSGKSGAAALAAKAAFRAGAGLVTVATPAGVQASVASGIPEVMTLPLPETADHTLSRQALPQLQTFLQSRNAIGMGPGLSTHAETAEVIRTLIAQCDRPIVIDADALNALAGHTSLLRSRPLSPIVTPHPGEMARLLGESTAATVNLNRLGIAQDFARTHSSIVVLKGARTIIAHPDGATAITPTGNPGMATAGTGDVLTGILAGLLAQGVSPWEAAQSGVYLHGLAGDLAAQAYGYPSLMAGDLCAYLPQAITHVLHAGTPPTVKPFPDHMAIEHTEPWTLALTSSSQTETFGSTIGRRLERGAVITLVGELGSGKTTFVRGVALGAGLDPHVVSSPTFTFIQEYVGPLMLAHVDLYRLEQSTELADTGLAEYFNGDFVVLIEWADRLPAAWLPDDYLSIHFLHTGKNIRRVKIQAFGPRSRGLLHAIMPGSR